MENTAELETILRALLISNPKVTKANRLESDFNETQGRQFPFRKLGFQSFLDYLKSIPKVVQLVPYNSSNPDVLPFVTKESLHIDKLVSKQKITSQRKSTSQSSRRGGYHGRISRPSGLISLRRRSPCNVMAPSQPMPLSRSILNKSIGIKADENRLITNPRREDFVKNGVNSARDLPCRANDREKCVDDKIIPKMSCLTSLSNYKSNNYNAKCIPANSEEDCDYTDSVYKHKGHLESVSEERSNNYKVEQCTQSDSPLMRHDSEDECNPGDVYESNLSDVMIQNFKKILAKYPNGIWATELPQKYFDEFRVTLDIMDLGYNSVISMVADIPDVFSYERAGPHDWKLYDASSFQQDSSRHNKDREDDFSEFNFERESYVPQSILGNIKNLVEQHPDGFRSTLLHSLYQAHFNKTLDLKTLGFKQLDDFLEVLKTAITVRKVTDYYLLMPKHTVLPLETVQSPAVDGLIPDEPFSFLGPDNVVRPGETIPVQELPPVNMHAKPDEALMEFEVRVGEVMSPGLFYLFLDSKYNDLQNMMEDLDKFYKQEEKHYQIPLANFIPNLYCACKYDELWHRAKIIGFQKDDLIEIEYIDYGTPAKVKKTELRLLQNDFAKLPAQAVCAKLAGIKPNNNEKKWPREVCKAFLQLVINERLLAYVYKVGIHSSKERVQIEVILFNTVTGEEEIIINEKLVEMKLAQFVNQNDPVAEEIISTMKEEETSTASRLPLSSGQADQCKRLGPPPGFEPLPIDKPSDAALSFPSMYSSQLQAASYLASYYTQPQHVQVNNYFPLTTIISSNGNLLPGQNSLLPNENGNLSLPQFGVQTSNLYNNTWKPHVAFSPSFGFIPPLPAPLPTSFYIPQPPEANIALQFRNVHKNQTNCNVPNLLPDSDFRQFTNHGTSQNILRKSDKIPGRSSDLSLSPQNINVLSQQILQQSITAEAQKDNNNLPNNVEDTSGSSTIVDEDDTEVNCISRPNTPLTPSSVKETNLSVQHLDKQMKGKFLQQETCKETNNNSLKSKCSETLIFSKATSISDDYAMENLEHIKQPKTCTAHTFSSKLENYNDENVPDSWEDIELDDTPAKAEHFSEDFKKPLDLIINEGCDLNVKIHEFPDITLNTSFPPTETTELPINWKDGFDPDIIGNSRSCPETIIKRSTSKDKLKKDLLVQQLEIENKSFHLICVNNKPAVISKEFYPQFTSFPFSVIEKILEMNHMAFIMICKRDEPALFSALEKVEFCGGVSKKVIIKLGKADISYLEDVPKVFSLLKLQNKMLLDKLREISSDFDSC